MRRIANIRGYMVTPYAGVWIEMIVSNNDSRLFCVTPYAGVWIEIETLTATQALEDGHSLRGSVD